MAADLEVKHVLGVAAGLPPGPAAALRTAAETGFFDGLQAGCLVASAVALAGAVVAAVALPSRPGEPFVPGADGAAAGDGASVRATQA